MLLTQCGIFENDFGVQNIAHIPINAPLMIFVSNQLLASKVRAYSVFPSSLLGSMGQVPYSSRTTMDAEITPTKSLSSKKMRTNSYWQFSSHIASAAATMRYRIQRRSDFAQDDMVCYHNEIPSNWLASVNQVFELEANFGIQANLEYPSKMVRA